LVEDDDLCEVEIQKRLCYFFVPIVLR
jgi:hypothetical protein